MLSHLMTVAESLLSMDGRVSEEGRILALCRAAIKDDLETAQWLFPEGKDIPTEAIDRVLVEIVEKGRGKPETVRWLLSKGTPPSGDRLSVVVFLAIKKGYLQIADEILLKGGTGSSDMQKSNLELALYKGDLDTVRWLLSKGLVISQDMIDQALIKAIVEAPLGRAQWMLSMGVNATVSGIDKALYEAAKNGYLDKVEWLLSEGRIASSGGVERALYAAAENGHLGIAQWLLSNGRVASPGAVDRALYAATKNGHLRIAQWLLSDGRIASQGGIDQALYAAAENGHLGIAQWLLSDGRIASQEGIDQALHLAALGAHLDVAQWLLSNGRVASQSGIDRALYSSVLSGRLDIAQWLLSNGRVASQSEIMRTLEYAIMYERLAPFVQWIFSEDRGVSRATVNELILRASQRGNARGLEVLLHLGPINGELRSSCITQARNSTIRAMLRAAPIIPGTQVAGGDDIQFELRLEEVASDPKPYMDRIYEEGLPRRIVLLGAHAVDVGGITKQFFMTLMQASKSKELIALSVPGLPMLREARRDADKDYLKKMGKFYALVDRKNQDRARTDKYALGNLFHSRFFDLVKIALREDLSEENKLKNIAQIVKEIDPIYAVTANLVCDPSEANKTAFREAMGSEEGEEEVDAKGAIEPFLEAAKAFASGVTPEFKDKILGADSSTTVLNSLQGLPISRERLLEALNVEEPNPGLNQRVAWIREKIGSASEEWMKAFIQSITAQQALALGLKIKLKDSWRNVYEIHTCFNSLDLPTQEMTKEEFLAALDASIAGNGYNIA